MREKNKSLEIKRINLERNISDANLNWFRCIFKGVELNSVINLLDVKKSINGLTKKKDFDFLSGLFDLMSELDSSSNENKFLKISATVFVMKNYFYDFISNPKEKFKRFITKVIGLAVSRNNNYELDDVKKIFKLIKKYDIETKLTVKWLSEMVVKSKSPLKGVEIIDYVSKRLHSNFKKDYIVNIINKTSSIDKLNKVFNLYEKEIYEIYLDYKDRGKIWQCLTPINKGGFNYSIPYISEDKKNWLENKKIGYRNHSIPYELISLRTEFTWANVVGDGWSFLSNEIKKEYVKEMMISALRLKENFDNRVKERIFKELGIEKELIDSVLNLNTSDLLNKCKNGTNVQISMIYSFIQNIKSEILKERQENDMVKILDVLNDVEFMEVLNKVIFKSDLTADIKAETKPKMSKAQKI